MNVPEKILNVSLSDMPKFVKYTDGGQLFVNVDEIQTADDAMSLLHLRFNSNGLIKYLRMIGKRSNTKLWDEPVCTEHESMFAFMNPKLIPQVSFGTGKGGVKKYHCKRFIADFYDQRTKTIIEIDGDSHLNKWEKKRDELRDKFFADVHGIKTVRFTNKQVEEILLTQLITFQKQDLIQAFVLPMCNGTSLESDWFDLDRVKYVGFLLEPCSRTPDFYDNKVAYFNGDFIEHESVEWVAGLDFDAMPIKTKRYRVLTS